MKKISIVWFRRDFRLTDNLAIDNAVKKGLPILAISVLDQSTNLLLGKNTKKRFFEALSCFHFRIDKKLAIYSGEIEAVFSLLCTQYHIDSIFFNACYEPWEIKKEEIVVKFCKKHSIHYEISNSNFLFHPLELMKHDGTPYKVFTAFKNKLLSLTPGVLVENQKHNLFMKDDFHEDSLPVLGNFFKKEKEVDVSFSVGEIIAKKKLEFFLTNKLEHYEIDRNFAAKNSTSGLSPFLHFGEISPLTILNALKDSSISKKEAFLNEIIWREFATYLLYFFPTMPKENLIEKFNRFSWNRDDELLKAWQDGKTGFPLIDAGIQELLMTGTMHNRVRMVVASFLVKNLNIHWHFGQAWFWEHLLDADLASNSMNWQWVAGTGVDAAPYFRIFNPITQSEKFDPLGIYIKHFVPELQNLPEEYIHDPSHAPEGVLKKAGITLGKTYPLPLVDLKKTREAALKRYHDLKF
jgi:deoxyribodipyrimidine photo-lyase